MGNNHRRIILVYAVFTLFFLSGLFVYALYRIESLSTENRAATEISLKSLGASLQTQFSARGSLDEKEISELFNKTLDSEPRLLAVVVQSKDYGILKAIMKSKEYLLNAQQGNYRGEVRFNKPTGSAELNIPLSLDFKSKSLPVLVSALYISFSSADSTRLIWEILYFLLGFFGLTVLVIAVAALVARGERMRPDAAGRGETDGYEGPIPDAVQPEIDEFETGPAAGRTPPFKIGRAEESALEEFQEPLELGGDLEEEALEIEQEIPQPPADELYAASSGLVKGAHFSERLDGELRRAASVGQDLALLVVSIDTVTAADFSLKRNFTEVVHGFFPLHELAFEYKKGLVAVIVPDEDGSAALKAAKQLFRELEAHGVRVTIGISSRCGRAVKQEVLAAEAEGALEHAREDVRHPVVLFRPDPKKFRDVMFP